MEMEDPGFSFRPEVAEMIKVLKFKARGGGDISQVTEAPGDISERDLYGKGKEPWKVFCGSDVKWNLFEAGDKKKKKFATYVVTKVSKLGDNKTGRKAGRGCWDGQTSETVFQKDGRDIAYMKQLSYVYYDSGDCISEAAGQLYYYLHEYYLSEEYLEKIGAVGTTYVLCRIVVDTTKPCRVELVKPSTRRRRTSRTRVATTTQQEQRHHQGSRQQEQHHHQDSRQQEQHHHQDSRQPTGLVGDPAMLTIGDYGFPTCPTESHEEQDQVSRQQMAIHDNTGLDKNNPIMLTDEDCGSLTLPIESQDQDQDNGFVTCPEGGSGSDQKSEGSIGWSQLVACPDDEFDELLAEFLDQDNGFVTCPEGGSGSDQKSEGSIGWSQLVACPDDEFDELLAEFLD